MNAPSLGRYWLLALSVCLPACTPAAPTADATPPASAEAFTGPWRAVLTSPGGDLPFALEITEEGGRMSAIASSGGERVPFSHVDIRGEDISLRFDWYDSRIDAHLDDESTMTGRWQKTVPGGVSQLEFIATRGPEKRFQSTLR